MITTRRNFLGLLAAPAIVRASSLMRVVPLPDDPWVEIYRIYHNELEYWKGKRRGTEITA